MCSSRDCSSLNMINFDIKILTLDCSENMDPVRAGIRGTVLILWIVKNSFPVFRNILLRTANILGFSKS